MASHGGVIQFKQPWVLLAGARAMPCHAGTAAPQLPAEAVAVQVLQTLNVSHWVWAKRRAVM